MTFQYTPLTPTDRERIRFAIGDTVQDRAMFSDEEITFQLSENVTWKPTVIAMLEGMVAQLAAQPNFTADWLTVSQSDALKYFSALLDRKRAEYGLGAIRAITAYSWRPDSAQTKAPTFDSEGE